MKTTVERRGLAMAANKAKPGARFTGKSPKETKNVLLRVERRYIRYILEHDCPIWVPGEGGSWKYVVPVQAMGANAQCTVIGSAFEINGLLIWRAIGPAGNSFFVGNATSLDDAGEKIRKCHAEYGEVY